MTGGTALLHWPAIPSSEGLPPVVLLHGSGQDEYALLGFAERACPGYPLVPVRGRVAWEDGYAFFRRNPDRTLDLIDLAQGAAAVQHLLATLRERGHQRPVLLGYSNGAIVAAAALALDPAQVAGAVLLRPLTPAPGVPLVGLTNVPVLLVSASEDDRRGPDDAQVLHEQLALAEAATTLIEVPTGHPLCERDAAVVAQWLRDHLLERDSR